MKNLMLNPLNIHTKFGLVLSEPRGIESCSTNGHINFLYIYIYPNSSPSTSPILSPQVVTVYYLASPRTVFLLAFLVPPKHEENMVYAKETTIYPCFSLSPPPPPPKKTYTQKLTHSYSSIANIDILFEDNSITHTCYFKRCSCYCSLMRTSGLLLPVHPPSTLSCHSIWASVAIQSDHCFFKSSHTAMSCAVNLQTTYNNICTISGSVISYKLSVSEK